MTWDTIGAFLHEHREGLGLLALAAVVTMRPKLPWPFVLVEPLEWCYEWGRDALLTFISLRGPHPPSDLATASKSVTEPGGKVTTESATLVSAPNEEKTNV